MFCSTGCSSSTSCVSTNRRCPSWNHCVDQQTGCNQGCFCGDDCESHQWLTNTSEEVPTKSCGSCFDKRDTRPSAYAPDSTRQGKLSDYFHPECFDIKSSLNCQNFHNIDTAFVSFIPKWCGECAYVLFFFKDVFTDPEEKQS